MKSFLLLIVVLMIATASCESAEPLSEQVISEPVIVTEQPKDPEFPELTSVPFAEGDTVSYGDHVVQRLSKKAKIDSGPGSSETTIDVTYAVVRTNGKVVREFDGTYGGFGNTTDFGLFSFLGGGSKQLAVSQTIPRGGRHWVVDLAENRVIFDSSDWGVGREEFDVVDINGDGVVEISMPLTAFYMFEDMSMAETPLPAIVFEYDSSAKEYLPANQQIADYVLRWVNDDIERARNGDEIGYLGRRLGIVLKYLYAGKDREAWEFFDKEYARDDKQEVKARIQDELRKEMTYQFLLKTRK